MSNKNTRKAACINLQTIIAVIAGGYGFSPIDFLPDFLPIIGLADDTTIIVLALVLMIIITIADRHSAQAAQNGGAE